MPVRSEPVRPHVPLATRFCLSLFLAAAFISSARCSAGTPAPVAVHAESLSLTGIRVTWGDACTNETGFVVQRTRNHVDWTNVATLAANVTNWTDSGLSPGTVYMYRVKSTGSDGDSEWSNWHFAATMCPIAAPWTPYDVHASWTPEGRILLTWSEHFGDETGFEIQRRIENGAFVNYATVGPDVTEYRDTSPVIGSNLSYRVRAVKGGQVTDYISTDAGMYGGTSSIYVMYPAAVSNGVAAPVNVRAEILEPHRVRVSWDDVATNETGYQVLYSWDDRHFRSVEQVSSNVTQVMFSRNIVPGHTYYVRVVAECDGLYSLPSASASFLTTVDATVARPSGLSVMKTGSSTVSVSWRDNSSNETGFAIMGNQLWVTNVPANVTNVTLTGYPCNSYSVQALKGTNGSALTPSCWLTMTEKPVRYGGFSSSEVANPRTNAVVASGTVASSPVGITSVARPYFRELQITGTSGNDYIVISQSNDTIMVTANGQAPVSTNGPFGDIQVKGEAGNDTIIVETNVTMRTRLIGGAGNDALNAFGSGKNCIVAVDGGSDSVVGNGLNTSYWVDQSALDTVYASREEILAGRVHRISAFYNGVTKNPNPGDLPDNTGYQYSPFSNGLSLWGDNPTMFDVDQGFHQNCPLTGRYQMIAHYEADRLQEMACDLGDNTYAVQYGNPASQSYARVDSQLDSNVGEVPPSASIWWPIIEKVIYGIGLGLPGANGSYNGYCERWLNVWDDADSVYEKVGAELVAGRTIGEYVNDPEALGSPARVAGHYHGFVQTYRDADGNPRFVIRNPYGMQFERNNPPYDPCQGLFDLSLDEMQAAFYGAYVQDFRFPPYVDAGQDQVVTDTDGSGSEIVTLTATNVSHWRVLSYVWSENGQTLATGGVATVSLPVGTHLICLTAIDDAGVEGGDSVAVTVVCGAMPGFVGEAGTITTNQSDGSAWQCITFSRPYTNPVVIMGPPSYGDTNPVTMRVRNVTPAGFDWQFDEWERWVNMGFWTVQVDGPHGTDTVSWLVAEAGVQSLEDGRSIAAGTAVSDNNWKTIAFGHAFPAPPVVLAQCMSQNETATVAARIRNVSTTNFQVRLQECEKNDGTHAAELLGWVAVEQATGTTAGRDYEAHITANAVTKAPYSIAFARTYSGAPVFLARVQTYNDSEPCDLRRTTLSASGVTVLVEEEVSADTEQIHGAEVVGYLALAPGRLDVAPDTDGDGILNHLDPDDDNDGMSDADEAVAGTNPLSASSVLAIRSFAVGVGGKYMLFDSIVGRHYTVEFSTNLMETGWHVLVPYLDVIGSGGAMPVNDTNESDKAFYRIGVHQ